MTDRSADAPSAPNLAGPDAPSTATAPAGVGQSAERGAGGRARAAAARLVRAAAGEVPARYWLLLGALFVLGYVYYHATHRGYTGDGLYYAAMALMRAGSRYWEALHAVGVYFHDPNVFRLDYGFFDPQFNPLIKPRVLYPILSAPFVRAFGVGGMWVVPALAAVYTLWGNATLLARLYGPRIAFAVLLPFLTTIAWWEFGTGVYTEPLAIALMTCLLRNLPLGRPARVRNHVMVALMLVALSLTRQMTTVPMAMLVAPFLWSVLRREDAGAASEPGGGRGWLGACWRRARGSAWLVSAAIGVIVGGLALFLLLVWAPYDALAAFLRNTHTKTLGLAIRHLPQIAWRLLKAESASYLRADLPMTLLWVAAIGACVARFRTYVAALFVGAAGSGVVFAVLNGVAGSLRYFFPMYPVLLLMVAEGVRWFFARDTASNRVAVDAPPTG